MSFSNSIEGKKPTTHLPETCSNTSEFSLYHPIQSLQNLCTRISSFAASIFNKVYSLFYSKPHIPDTSIKNRVKPVSPSKPQFKATQIKSSESETLPTTRDHEFKNPQNNISNPSLHKTIHSCTSVSSSSFSPRPPAIPSSSEYEDIGVYEKRSKENTHTVVDPSLNDIKHSIHNMCEHALHNVIPGYQNEIQAIIASKVRQFCSPFPLDPTFLHSIEDVVSSQYVDEILKSSSKLLSSSSVNFVDLISGRFLFALENMDHKNLCNNIAILLNNHLKGILPLIKQERIAKLKEKNNNPTIFPTDFEREKAAKEKALKDRTDRGNAIKEHVKHKEDIKLRCQSMAEILMKMTFAQQAIGSRESILSHPILSLIHKSLTELLIDKIEMISLEQAHLDEIMTKKILPEVYDSTLDSFLELIIEHYSPKLIPLITDFQHKQDAIRESKDGEIEKLNKELENSKDALFDLIYDLICAHYRVDDVKDIETLCNKIWKLIPQFTRLNPKKSLPQYTENGVNEVRSKGDSEIRSQANPSIPPLSTAAPKQDFPARNSIEESQVQQKKQISQQYEEIEGLEASDTKSESSQIVNQFLSDDEDDGEVDSEDEVETKLETDRDLTFNDNALATEFIEIIKNIAFEMGECDRPDIEDGWTNGLRKKSVGMLIHSVFKLGESKIKEKLLDQVNQLCDHPEKIYRKIKLLVLPTLNQRMLEKTIHDVIKVKLQAHSSDVEGESKRSNENESKYRNERNRIRLEAGRKRSEKFKSPMPEQALGPVAANHAPEPILESPAPTSHPTSIPSTLSNKTHQNNQTSASALEAPVNSPIGTRSSPILKLTPEQALQKQFKNLASLINDVIYFQTSSEINNNVNSKMESIFKFLPGFVKKWVVKPSANAFSWGMEKGVNGLISTAAPDEDVLNLITKIYKGLVSYHKNNQLLITDIALASVESLQKTLA